MAEGIQSNDAPLEIFHLIWLDADINTKDIQDAEQKLRSIINQLKKFQDVEQCQTYIEQRSQKDRVIMIVSGRLGREIVPSVYKLRQVTSVYVYCVDENSNNQWADKFAKVKLSLETLIPFDGLFMIGKSCCF